MLHRDDLFLINPLKTDALLLPRKFPNTVHPWSSARIAEASSCITQAPLPRSILSDLCLLTTEQVCQKKKTTDRVQQAFSLAYTCAHSSAFRVLFRSSPLLSFPSSFIYSLHQNTSPHIFLLAGQEEHWSYNTSVILSQPLPSPPKCRSST